MFIYLKTKKQSFTFSALSRLMVLTLSLSLAFAPVASYAQVLPQTIFNLPAVGTMVPLSAGFTPTIIKGMTIFPDNPLNFDFIIDTGDEGLEGKAFEQESKKLIKYFLASLTVPEEDQWVNLSPYEKDRIVPQSLSLTEMGRDLLAQDYLLKQISASLMYPEEEIGRKFWDRVYTKAQDQFGTTEVPMNTFNKIWIVPNKATLYEKDGNVFILENHLKVMLEEDYIALQEGLKVEKFGLDSRTDDNSKIISGVTSEVVREVLIPEIEREVNEGKNFAKLRQVYNSMLLATWYKRNLKESLLGQIYVDQNKMKGIDTVDANDKEKIYNQYVEAFKTGVYNYIKEDYDAKTDEIIPRKYFSGGMASLDGVPIQMAGSPIRKNLDDLAGVSRVARVRLDGIENGKIVQVNVGEKRKLGSVSSPVLDIFANLQSFSRDGFLAIKAENELGDAFSLYDQIIYQERRLSPSVGEAEEVINKFLDEISFPFSRKVLRQAGKSNIYFSVEGGGEARSFLFDKISERYEQEKNKVRPSVVQTMIEFVQNPSRYNFITPRDGIIVWGGENRNQKHLAVEIINSIDGLGGARSFSDDKDNVYVYIDRSDKEGILHLLNQKKEELSAASPVSLDVSDSSVRFYMSEASELAIALRGINKKGVFEANVKDHIIALLTDDFRKSQWTNNLKQYADSRESRYGKEWSDALRNFYDKINETIQKTDDKNVKDEISNAIVALEKVWGEVAASPMVELKMNTPILNYLKATERKIQISFDSLKKGGRESIAGYIQSFRKNSETGVFLIRIKPSQDSNDVSIIYMTPNKKFSSQNVRTNAKIHSEKIIRESVSSVIDLTDQQKADLIYRMIRAAHEDRTEIQIEVNSGVVSGEKNLQTVKAIALWSQKEEASEGEISFVRDFAERLRFYSLGNNLRYTVIFDEEKGLIASSEGLLTPLRDDVINLLDRDLIRLRNQKEVVLLPLRPEIKEDEAGEYISLWSTGDPEEVSFSRLLIFATQIQKKFISENPEGDFELVTKYYKPNPFVKFVQEVGVRPSDEIDMEVALQSLNEFIHEESFSAASPVTSEILGEWISKADPQGIELNTLKLAIDKGFNNLWKQEMGILVGIYLKLLFVEDMREYWGGTSLRARTQVINMVYKKVFEANPQLIKMVNDRIAALPVSIEKYERSGILTNEDVRVLREVFSEHVEGEEDIEKQFNEDPIKTLSLLQQRITKKINEQPDPLVSTFLALEPSMPQGGGRHLEKQSGSIYKISEKLKESAASPVVQAVDELKAYQSIIDKIMSLQESIFLDSDKELYQPPNSRLRKRIENKENELQILVDQIANTNEYKMLAPIKGGRKIKTELMQNYRRNLFMVLGYDGKYAVGNGSNLGNVKVTTENELRLIAVAASPITSLQKIQEINKRMNVRISEIYDELAEFKSKEVTSFGDKTKEILRKAENEIRAIRRELTRLTSDADAIGYKEVLLELEILEKSFQKVWEPVVEMAKKYSLVSKFGYGGGSKESLPSLEDYDSRNSNGEGDPVTYRYSQDRAGTAASPVTEEVVFGEERAISIDKIRVGRDIRVLVPGRGGVVLKKLEDGSIVFKEKGELKKIGSEGELVYAGNPRYGLVGINVYVEGGVIVFSKERESADIVKVVYEKIQDKVEPPDVALSVVAQKVQKTGGINLNPAPLDMDIKHDADWVPINYPAQPNAKALWRRRMNIEGFVPIILNVAPVNIPLLLGLTDEEDSSELSFNTLIDPFDKEDVFYYMKDPEEAAV